MRSLHVVTDPATGTDGTDDRWEPPLPLAGRHRLPTFPVEVLPAWVGDYVQAVATETQTPVDLPGCIALAALSASAGGRAEVEVRGRWHEPVNIFTLVALPPGSRKSAVFSAIVRPLLDVERQLADEAKTAIAAAELERRIATDHAEKAARTATAADPAKAREAMGLATDAAMAAASLTVPTVPRLVADDVTPEKAASLLAEHGGRIAVLSAEGGIVGTLAGRYSSAPNYEVFLKGHAGDLYRIDRQGRPAEHIEKPALTLGLAIQPEVLRDLANVPGGRGKGLLGRILYSLPDDLVGRRQIGPPQVPADVANTYHAGLAALTRELAEGTEPAVLTLTPAAADLVLALEAETEPRLATGAEWGHLRDWYGKWVGAIARLAGLLHLAEHTDRTWGHAIAERTWQAAETIGRYYADHALAAFDYMGADPTTENARALLGWIERTRPRSFTVRDAFRANRTHFAKVPDLEPALDLLESHGHVRAAPRPDERRPGRQPSPTYYTHPTHRGEK
ncbi:MAG: YfjI family protein [Actinopolymorphaceae bacterium]